MKTTFLHWYQALAASILSILGFSSCGSSSDDGPWDGSLLYGTPTSSFQLKGNVTAEDGTPIKGIKVVLHEGRNGEYMHLDSAYTDRNGNYETGVNYRSPNYNEWIKSGIVKVVMEDVDGEANGGEFATDTIPSQDITVKHVSAGTSTWDSGSYEITANGKMKKKEQK